MTRAVVFRILAAMATAAALASACRPRDGGHCVCHGECAAGLICTQSGRVLAKGECVNTKTDPTPGECTPVDDLEGGGGQAKYDVGIRFDIGGKRDFIYVPDASTSSSGTTIAGSSSDATSDGSGASTSSGGASNSSSGTSTSSSGASTSSGGESDGSLGSGTADR